MNLKTFTYLTYAGEAIALLSASVAAIYGESHMEIIPACAVLMAFGCGMLMAGFSDVEKEKHSQLAKNIVFIFLFSLVITIGIKFVCF